MICQEEANNTCQRGWRSKYAVGVLKKKNEVLHAGQIETDDIAGQWTSFPHRIYTEKIYK